MDQFERTRRLLGDGAMDRLSASRVAVFGVGGVGGHAAEALARSGVGAIELFDDDRVSLTNLNRQIVATHATLGRYKADAMAERLRDISPDAEIVAHRMFYMPQNAGMWTSQTLPFHPCQITGSVQGHKSQNHNQAVLRCLPVPVRK